MVVAEIGGGVAKLNGIAEMQWWVMRVGNEEVDVMGLCESELKVIIPK